MNFQTYWEAGTAALDSDWRNLEQPGLLLETPIYVNACPGGLASRSKLSPYTFKLTAAVGQPWDVRQGHTRTTSCKNHSGPLGIGLAVQLHTVGLRLLFRICFELDVERQ